MVQTLMQKQEMEKLHLVNKNLSQYETGCIVVRGFHIKFVYFLTYFGKICGRYQVKPNTNTNKQCRGDE